MCTKTVFASAQVTVISMKLVLENQQQSGAFEFRTGEKAKIKEL